MITSMKEASGMRSKRTTPEEQLRLIQECRSSGLSDWEWCQEHGIHPKTFYTWIYRLKKKGEIDIPATIPIFKCSYRVRMERLRAYDLRLP